jgi:hypothetical protein
MVFDPSCAAGARRALFTQALVVWVDYAQSAHGATRNTVTPRHWFDRQPHCTHKNKAATLSYLRGAQDGILALPVGGQPCDSSGFFL